MRHFLIVAAFLAFMAGTSCRAQGGAALTEADASAWLDGFMPASIELNDVAGAAVVIVKDGAVLVERGYGYADLAAGRKVDPRTTLFRLGSVSKLFTWTAVMQLIEAGQLELDRDVNAYLDFRIPPFDGKPITLRQMMTHTAGFEDAFRELLIEQGPSPDLETVVKRWVPARIFAPGSTPAYSNYATMLAGYIVQRVSGEPFADYVERHIFTPLGMSRSSFRQPLPDALAPLMSLGYPKASLPAQPFELVTATPAGGLSASVDDLAKFMIAHLDESHGALLKPATKQQMQRTPLTLLPPLNRMLLGFFEANRNGQAIIAHGGDTQWFHSNLWLLIDAHVGMFISLNSNGGEAAANIRDALILKFMERYFPASTPKPAFTPDPEHARAVAGTYQASRRSESNLRRAQTFFTQARFTVTKDGSIHTESPAFRGLNDAPRRWIEVAPFVWQEADGPVRLAALSVDGKVQRLSSDELAPTQVFERVPWYRSSTWLRPALLASLVLLALTVLSAPLSFLARRYYGAARGLLGDERKAYLRVVWAALLVLVLLARWLKLLVSLRFQPLGFGTYVLQIATMVGLPVLCLTALGLLHLSIARGRSAATISAAGLVSLASLCVLWVAVVFNLTHLGVRY